MMQYFVAGNCSTAKQSNRKKAYNNYSLEELREVWLQFHAYDQKFFGT